MDLAGAGARSSPATKHGREFLKGRRMALAGHPHEVVVMRAGDREKALGRRRGLEEPLCVPEGHDLVGLTMHEEDGTADMRDLVDVPELVERQEGQPGHDPEGRHEARLDDESGHGVARGEIHGRPAPTERPYAITRSDGTSRSCARC